MSDTDYCSVVDKGPLRLSQPGWLPILSPPSLKLKALHSSMDTQGQETQGFLFIGTNFTCTSSLPGSSLTSSLLSSVTLTSSLSWSSSSSTSTGANYNSTSTAASFSSTSTGVTYNISSAPPSSLIREKQSVVAFHHVEQYMHACKAVVFKDFDTLDKIMKQVLNLKLILINVPASGRGPEGIQDAREAGAELCGPSVAGTRRCTWLVPGSVPGTVKCTWYGEVCLV